MSNSLRDQLMGLGFSAPAKPERKPEPRKPHPNAPAHKGARKPGQPGQPSKPGQRPPQPQSQGKPKPKRNDGEFDLAKAYAIRAQKEKDERMEAERQKQEQARLRREAKAKLEVLLKEKGLNDAEADIARHFEYGGKIKRIYVNAEQLKQLNAGELGVVQMNGRYLLVEASLLVEAEATFAPSVALKVDPNATPEEDPYADPLYKVPDDLVW